MWWEVITDALLDTVKLFPFLFLLYILIELMEHNTQIGKAGGRLSGRAAPLIGAATGLVPMCGFSVMAAKLYERRHLTLGTLLAVFIATSDEAFFVLLLSPMGWLEKLYSVLALCGVKIALGAAAGYLADLLFRSRKTLAPLQTAEEHAHEHACAKEHMHGGEHKVQTAEHSGEEHMHVHEHAGELSVCEHKKGRESVLSLYFVSPLLHALKIAAFILLFNLAFGFLVFGIGEERVTDFLQGAGYWYQPLVCSIVGLIPNCVSSVALAEVYAVGGIAFGSFAGGLVTNAGLGYLVLFRKAVGVKKALCIVLFMLLLGIAAGYAGNAIGLLL